MKFKNKRFISKGVADRVGPLLQLFMWQCIDEMPEPKDYLQVFWVIGEPGKQWIRHSQEVPRYEREYRLYTDTPFFACKIFVIDDGSHTTMLLASEY